MRFPCNVSPMKKFLRFLMTTALQRKLISRLARIRSRGTRDPTAAYDLGGTLPAYGPVTELSGFLSFQFTGCKSQKFFHV